MTWSTHGMRVVADGVRSPTRLVGRAVAGLVGIIALVGCSGEAQESVASSAPPARGSGMCAPQELAGVPATVRPGQTLHVSGRETTCADHGYVDAPAPTPSPLPTASVRLEGTAGQGDRELGFVRPDVSTGAFALTVTIPSDAVPGRYYIATVARSSPVTIVSAR